MICTSCQKIEEQDGKCTLCGRSNRLISEKHYRFPYLIKYYGQGYAFYEHHRLLKPGDDLYEELTNFQPRELDLAPLQIGRLEAQDLRTSTQQAALTPDTYPSRLYYSGQSSVTDASASKPYTTISYTWGRWKDADTSNASDLFGAHWKVPANHLFTRADLDTVVEKIGNGGHVWLDVFCIPQIDDDPEMAREIGKQGEIFKNAATSAVWLNSGGANVILDITSWTSNAWTNREGSGNDMKAFHLFGSSAVEKAEQLRQLHVLISLPEKVPWTTSLWTLQEAALRQDALFYDSNGDALIRPRSNEPLKVSDLVYGMSHIRDELKSWIQSHTIDDPEKFGLVLEAWEAVEITMFGRVDGANALQLLQASHRRFCSRAHDRTYGIMNALGVSVRVDYSLPAQTVANEMTLALWNRCPAEMQSFWQAVPSAGKRSWILGDEAIGMSQMRQDHSSTAPRAHFHNVESDGSLAGSLYFPLKGDGADWLCQQLESGHGSFCYDGHEQENVYAPELPLLEERIVNSRNMRSLVDSESVVLLPLGKALPTTHLGPAFVYLLTAVHAPGNSSHQSTPLHLHRIGLLILTSQVTDCVNEASDTAFILS